MGTLTHRSTWLATLAVCAASARAQDQVPLYPSALHATEDTPRCARLDDLDHDGNLDLVIANEGASSVSVYLGDGLGGLGPGADFPVGASPTGVVVGDLDLNGDVDLAVACEGPGTVSVLLGDGAGGFGPAQEFPTIDGATVLALGDFDLDDAPDLAVIGGASIVSILLGDGAGAFAAPYGIAAGMSDTAKLLVHDVNVDGKPDLLTGPQWGIYVFVHLGDGAGGFAPSQSTYAGNYVSGMAMDDVDGNGFPDLVVELNVFGVLAVHYGDGSGGFPTSAQFPSSGASGTKIVDVDLDGRLDLVFIRGGNLFTPGALAVMLGDGLGAFAPPTSVAIGPTTSSLVLGDLDGDASPDALTLQWYHDAACVHLGDGQGGFVVGRAVDVGGEAWEPAVADLDEDGDPDMAVGLPYEGQFAVLLGDGAGGFAAPLLVDTGHTPRAIAVGDLDEDGHLDLAVSLGSAGGIGLFVGDGQGGFAQAATVPVAAGSEVLLMGDLNGDGHQDLVTVGPSANLTTLLFGDGSGWFLGRRILATGGDARSVCVGDLNVDGVPDLVAGNWQSSSVTVLLGLGGGQFAAPQGFALPTKANTVRVADLDRDGWPDVVVACHFTKPGYVGVLLGDGQGGFGSAQYVDCPRAVAMELVDVDGDALVDVVVTNKDEARFSVYLGDGQGGLGPPMLFTSISKPEGLTLTDLDLNGRPDLLLIEEAAPEVFVLLNQLPPPPSCTTQVTYCAPKWNSSGCLPRICSAGEPTASGADDFEVSAQGVLSHQLGLFFWGHLEASQPFFGGTLCVAPPIERTTAQVAGGLPGVNDCGGTYTFHFSQAYMGAMGLTPGTLVFGQYWSRDPFAPPPGNVGLTDAIQFVIQP